MIYPCIDLMNGKVVQLVQGKAENKQIELDSYEDMITKFKPFKTIQLIDLDAAMGKGENYGLIKEIIKEIKCRVGGGIRSIKKAKELIDLGVEKVIIGSSIFMNGKINFDFLNELLKQIKRENIIIALDTVEGYVVIKGWKETTNYKAEDIITELEPYCSEFLTTFVDKEGMLQGTDVDFFKLLKSKTKNAITAAGGITTLDEVKQLQESNISSALGMAIYTGKIKLEELLKIKQ